MRRLDNGDIREINNKDQNKEKELDSWWQEYIKEENKIIKKYPLKNSILWNQHPVNQLMRKYWKKKNAIYEKR